VKLQHLVSTLLFPVLVVWYSIWKHLATRRNLQLFIVGFTMVLASGFLTWNYAFSNSVYFQAHPIENIVVLVTYLFGLTGLVSMMQSVKTRNWLLLIMGFLTMLIAWQILETLYKAYGIQQITRY